MLALGMSDHAIATAQGTSVRTVQRRVSDAMAHYRVSSRFELGVAWAAGPA
jgi:DNA-binding NarL/FixJ family response regulator